MSYAQPRGWHYTVYTDYTDGREKYETFFDRDEAEGYMQDRIDCDDILRVWLDYYDGPGSNVETLKEWDAAQEMEE